MTTALAYLSPTELRRVQKLATVHSSLGEKLKGVNLDKIHEEKREKHPLSKPYQPKRKGKK